MSDSGNYDQGMKSTEYLTRLSASSSTINKNSTRNCEIIGYICNRSGHAIIKSRAAASSCSSEPKHSTSLPPCTPPLTPLPPPSLLTSCLRARSHTPPGGLCLALGCQRTCGQESSAIASFPPDVHVNQFTNKSINE